MAGRPVMNGLVMGLPVVHLEIVKPGPKMKFVFKMFKEDGNKSPLLVPLIDNPSKVPVPGILQFINGDLGIAEKIFSPILAPIIPFFAKPPVPVEDGKSKPGSYKYGSLSNLNASQKDYADSMLGQNIGFKSFEKASIQGMFESMKPLMEISLIIVELLAVIEDAIARYLATSIKVPKIGWIGFPSRKPKYTFGSLNHNLKHFRKALQEGTKAFNSGDSYSAIANSTPAGSSQPPPDVEDPDTRDSIYLAYFDEDGNLVEPPAWIKNSGKWGFNTDQPVLKTTTGDDPEKFGFPFLSDESGRGVNQLYKYHINLLSKTPALIQKSDDKTKSIESNVPPKFVNEQELIQALGTDFQPGVHVNELNGQVNELKDNINSTVRTTILTEYINKHLNSQLKNRYIEKESTGQIFENKNIGDDVNPEDRNSIRIVYPSFSTTVTLTGDQQPSTVNAEVYTVPKGRIATQLTPYNDDFRIRNDDGSYVEIRKEKDRNIYYEKVNLVQNFQDTDNLEAYFNTDPTPVAVPKDKLIVPENKQKYRNNKIPGKVLSYYLPLEWEEILEYEVRKSILKKDAAGNTFKETVVVGTESETIQNRIDPESEYQIRLIQVINLPILTDGSINNLASAFPKPNYLVVFREHLVEQPAVAPTMVPTRGNPFAQPFVVPEQPKPISYKYVQISELTSDTPIIANVSIVSDNVDNIKSFRLLNQKDRKPLRYVNTDTLKVNDYYYLRFLNTEFGKEFSSKDNGEFYQISSIKENWVQASITSSFNSKMNNIAGTYQNQPVMQETKNDNSEIIYFEAETQTIKLHKSKNILPSFVTEATQPQLQILSGTINTGRYFVYKIQTVGDYVIYNIKPELSEKPIVSEKIVAQYYFDTSSKNFKLLWNQATILIQYLESNEISLSGRMSSYTGAIEMYGVKQLSVIDDIFKQKGNSIYIDGVNRELNYRDQRDAAEAIRKVTSYINDADKIVDGFYKANGIVNITTKKGLNIDVIDLEPGNFGNITDRTAYISNAKASWYRPLRIAEAPTSQDIEGDNNIGSFNKQTGTAFYDPKTIAPQFRIPRKYKGENYEHIAPSINMGNAKGEAIVFQGLDPRYVDRTKWKVFWLVEAVKKDIAPIIFGEAQPGDPTLAEEIPTWLQPYPDSTPDTDPGGKEWYNLIHKLTVVPYLISKVGLVLFSKLIPAIKKLIKLITNPAKITDLLLEIGRLKLAKNMEFFDDTYKKTLQADLNKALSSESGRSKYFYTGKVNNPDMPVTASYILDGIGVVKFGACLGLNFPFGVKVNALKQAPNQPKPTFNNGWFESIIGDERTPEEKDTSKYQTKRNQPIIKMILSLLKIPFEVLFMIVKWLLCWIKKLLNPATLIPAVVEFLSFKWLLCMIHPMTILKIIGASSKSCGCGCGSDSGDLSPDLLALLGKFDYDAEAPENAQDIIDDLIKDLAGLGNKDLIEVLVYNIYRNGIYVRSEEVTVPYKPYGDSDDPGSVSDGTGINGANTNNDSVGRNPAGNSLDVDGLNGNDSNAAKRNGCGPSNFDLSALINLPFVSDMPKFNKCELIQLFLKPLEMILGIIRTIQEFVNTFIGMPVSILGLEPTMSLPRLDIVGAIESKIEKLKQVLEQTTPRPLV